MPYTNAETKPKPCDQIHTHMKFTTKPKLIPNSKQTNTIRYHNHICKNDNQKTFETY